MSGPARRRRRRFRHLFALARLGALAAVVARLRRGAARRPPVLPTPRPDEAGPLRLSVVVPARDEQRRLAPLLWALALDPDVDEVLVVDDCSTDGTAALAASHGATVVAGTPPPPGWVGKPWALQQGLDRATGDWVLCLDADVEPEIGLARAMVERARADGWDLCSVGARFTCDTPGQRWLHPAMLATLVYRFGPPGTTARPAPSRALANGQCFVVRRHQLQAAGGFARVRGHLTDDVALARSLAAEGWQVGFLDGTRAVQVRMHDSLADVWRSWGRSLPMPDATSPAWQVADLATLWLALGLPLPRLLARRGDVVDVAALAVRLGTLAATAPAYTRRGAAWWASPLADPAAVARLTWGALRPGRTWRGRTYPADPTGAADATGGADPADPVEPVDVAAEPSTPPGRSGARSG